MSVRECSNNARLLLSDKLYEHNTRFTMPTGRFVSPRSIDTSYSRDDRPGSVSSRSNASTLDSSSVPAQTLQNKVTHLALSVALELLETKDARRTERDSQHRASTDERLALNAPGSMINPASFSVARYESAYEDCDGHRTSRLARSLLNVLSPEFCANMMGVNVRVSECSFDTYYRHGACANDCRCGRG
jgi:hypothetical protein